MRGVLWEWLFLDRRLSCGQMMWSLQSIGNAFQMAAQQTGRLGLYHHSQVRVSQNALSLDSHHLSLLPSHLPCLMGRLAWSSPGNAQQAPPEAHLSDRCLQPTLI